MRRIAVFLALTGLVLLLASFLPWPAGSGESSSLPDSTTPDTVAQGVALFRAKGCVSCHHHAAVEGSWGSVGPDLTAYDADPAFLSRWLRDPAAVRPNTLMPNLGLEQDEIEALIAFLESESGPTDTGK